MIQELLGGAGIIEEDRKFSINSTLESSPSLSPSSSTITATATAAAAVVPASSSASAENQNLRCPRCNSSNTKFCYYNNYNLTQPRHFCKTCRRYWTKGGALRNVPIGGGCRKNKNVSVATGAKSSPGRLKNVSAEIGKAGGLVGGFDQELPSNPALWASPPQNSQFLALLRATQNPNPNPNPISVKEGTLMIGSHLASNSMGRTLGLDLFNQDPGSFFWRNNQHQAQQQQQQQNHHHHHHHHQHHPQQTGFILGEVQSSQEIYQRLRSIPNYYNPDHSPVLLSNAGSSSSSTILESAPASATELGYWNPALPWSDLPTRNGAYP